MLYTLKMASEEIIAVENTVQEKAIDDGSIEESLDASEKVNSIEFPEIKTEEEEKNIPDKMDDSSEAVIHEENGKASGEGVDTGVTESECVTEQPNKSAEPSAISDDKDKKDSEQKKLRERRRRTRRTGKGALMKELAALNLPDGVILVKDRRYTGYHCTYCNCVLRSLATMRAHVGGKWHKRTLQMKMVNEKKKRITSSSKSSVPPNQKVPPKEPLKSSLEGYLSTTKARIVGLSYIIETQRPNKDPTFQCNLCEVSCDSSDIKDHISGIKHCLMYSKLMKPAKLAELLAKQLTKAEKNKEIAKLSEELERENGRGEITVKFLQAKSTTGASNQRSRNSRVARRNAQRRQHKRRNDGMSPAQKRQLLERDFQARVQYSMRGAQNNFISGGWSMGNKPVDAFRYQKNAGFYTDYPNFYRDSYGERDFNRRYANEPYEQMGRNNSREMYHREKYDSRQSYWNDRHDNFTSNKPSSYNDRSASPAYNEGYSRNSNAPISALKRLAGFNVTSEEDAGVVINAINSLTNSVMNYKLRDLSQPVQQLLQKSMKSNELTSLLDLPVKKSGFGSTRDRYGGRSSQMDRDWGINQIAKPKNWIF